MAYSPTDWADGLTPVDEAHLDKIEQGIVTADANATAAQAALPAKENKSEKGAVNGYAPLDGTSKVPAANLPPGGADLSFDGDWAAGTYQDGDTVVKDGVVFMCVGGPTTTPPDASIWGIVPQTATIGTSLPAAPVDGQEAILVDSLTAPTYQWRFRYMASITDAYKWVFVGGAPAQAFVATMQSLGAPLGTWLDPSTPGPLFVVPRLGIYDAWGNVRGYSAAANNLHLGITNGAVGAGAPYATIPLAAGGYNAVHTMTRTGAIPAGTDIRLRYAQDAANGQVDSRSLQVRPLRVA